jgi:hypothetical protein
MWITNSFAAKVLVWVAAALLPVNMLFAGACGCGERSPGDAQNKSLITSAPANCCCHSGAACRCCHRAQKVQQTTCCKNRSHQAADSRGHFAPLCVCPSNRTPATQIPLSDSSAAKQLIGHACAFLSPGTAAELASASPSAADNLYFPIAMLDRLSILCRFTI